MLQFDVGKEFPLANCRGLEGFFFSYHGDTVATLTGAFPNIAAREVDMLTLNHGQIGLFMYEEIIFLSFKFGELNGDFAYSVHMSGEPKDIIVPYAEDGKGLGLGIFAVDSTNNVLKGMRMCGLGSQWTRTFGQMIESQKRMDFDENAFFAKVISCQGKWSSLDLLDMSVEVYKIGTKEGEDLLDMFRR